MTVIDGTILRDALISGANQIYNQRKQIDALNVFPVPDGDTGTNISMTFGVAKRELELLPDETSVSEVMKVAASALLRGARGNSGVIMSLLFRGWEKTLDEKETANSADLLKAMQLGVEAAYKAVMKPTEGTILTVARVSTERMQAEMEAEPDLDLLVFWEHLLAHAKETLQETPELLPVLKKAGVVDAGGKGLVAVFEGIYYTLLSGKIAAMNQPSAQPQGAPPADLPDERNAAGEYEGEITFTYCTEFLVMKGTHSNAQELRDYLESIGDSAVVVDADDLIKCHVHTDAPGNALQKGLENGALVGIKIDNMREQHISKRRSAPGKARPRAKRFLYAPVDPSVQYGFVAVAAGEGLQALFQDMGVKNVVSGGQTMNPSTDDILEAVHGTPARTVIVLPNNKNIVMAAEQTVKLADREVYVLPTSSVPQGLAALLAFDAACSLQENQLQMVRAIEKVGSGQITFAARDSVYDGHKIQTGDLLAMENGKMTFAEKDLEKAVVRLTRNMVKRDSTFIVLIYGSEVTDEQAEKIEEAVRAKVRKTVEISSISGGQPVYYYMISVE